MRIGVLSSTTTLLLCISMQPILAFPADDSDTELALLNDTRRSGPKGEKGDPGPPGPQSGGVVYTRWGSSTCGDVPGTELVYSGIAGKGYYAHKGGGVDYQCLPSQPQFYEDYRSGVQGNAPMYGVQYENPITGSDDHNMPCAVCYSSTRITHLMIPAKLQCPDNWTTEYSGYLMSSHYTHYASTYVCVDHSQESIPGSSDDIPAAKIYHDEPICNSAGFPCPPYNAGKELTCVVCTK